MASLPYHVIDGKAYPRVTSVLNHLRVPELEDWRADVGEVEAGKVGRQTARFRAGACLTPPDRLATDENPTTLRDFGVGFCQGKPIFWLPPG